MPSFSHSWEKGAATAADEGASSKKLRPSIGCPRAFPFRDNRRHGCRRLAYRDVFTACPGKGMPVDTARKNKITAVNPSYPAGPVRRSLTARQNMTPRSGNALIKKPSPPPARCVPRRNRAGDAEGEHDEADSLHPAGPATAPHPAAAAVHPPAAAGRLAAGNGDPPRPRQQPPARTRRSRDRQRR